MFYKRFLLFFLILLGGLDLVYSDNVCCYSSDLGIQPRINGNCLLTEVELGPIGGTFGSPCGEFEDKRQGCVRDGVCFSSVLGSKVYDIPEVLAFVDTSNFCDDLIDFDESLCVADATITIGGDENTSIGGGVGDGSGINIDNVFGNTSTSSDQINVCAGAGGPFGFFGNKIACEAQVVGGSGCLYNPYLGGFLNSNLNSVGSQSLDRFEDSCIPKSEIRECLDYKTRDNCEANPSREFSDELLDNCRWVETQEFSETLFSEKTGICISKSIDENKNFVKSKYSDRGNIVLSSSFESNVNVWDGIDSSNLINSVYSFHGSTSYRMISDSSISQSIGNINSDSTYSTFVYVKPIDFDNSSRIQLKISKFDENGGKIGTDFESTISIRDVFNANSNYFSRVNFVPLTLTDDVSDIEVEIISIGGEYLLDGVAIQASSSQSVLTSTVSYIPTEIISSGASRCELCHEETNINLCTREKSDLLGDCTYMVESAGEPYGSNLENYLGRDRNIYTKNNREWESQSLSSSKLFCELYISESSCVDPNNFVNSKFSSSHTQTIGTLCKWSEGVGCYKDSDGNSFPDTRQGLPYLRSLTENDRNVFNSFSAYAFGGNGSDVSDFEFACDTLPPNSYVYLIGKDSNGSDVLISDNTFEGIIGNVIVNVDVSDTFSESCEPFNLTGNIFVDFGSNNEFWFREVNSNILKESLPLKDFFRGRNDSLIVLDGFNSLSFIFRDQAGNIGKDWKYDLNLDINAPEIELISATHDESFFISDIFGPNSILEFEISDSSEITSCSYNLEPANSALPSSFFTPGGDINLEDIDNDKLNFSLPIFDSSVNPDLYILTLECTDIFDQEKEISYGFYADHSTEIVVVNPRSFTSEQFDLGFIGGNTDFLAVSSERDLSFCTLEFENTDYTGSSSLSVETLSSSFNLSDLGFSESIFFTRITGEVDFLDDGIKKGSIMCVDSLGNEFKEDLVYYYDSIEPKLNSFEIRGTEISGIKSVVEVDGEYYTDNNINLDLNLNIDGTGSWPSRNLNLSYVDLEGNVINVFESLTSSTILDNSTFNGTVSVKGFEFLDNEVKGFIENEEDLFSQNYDLVFFDKSGNSEIGSLKYFYDTSKPRLNFQGDVVTQDDNSIYVASNNPEIVISFDAPDYRTYTCSINGVQGAFDFLKTFEDTNLLKFNLTDISPSLTVDDGRSVNLNFQCKDVYGKTITKGYNLVYDDSKPVLREIFLENSNEKFLRNFQNFVYQDIVDNLVFNLDNTGEVEYSCKYSFIPRSDVYECNTEEFSVDFTGSGFKSVDNLIVLGGSNSNSLNPICVRRDSFDNVQIRTLENKEPFDTSIAVEAYCVDKVGLETQRRKLTVDVSYVSGRLGGLEFEYKDGLAFPIVRSFDKFDSILISSVIDGNSPYLVLRNPGNISNGIYTYTSNLGIDISDFSEGRHLVYAVVKDSLGEIIESVSGNIVVDKVAPNVDLDIPDANGNDLFVQRFIMNLGANDLNGELEKVELFLEDELIYSSNNLSGYNREFLDPVQDNENFFTSDFSGYVGVVSFRGELGKTYTFTLKALDRGGNLAESSKTVVVRDGVGITLIDSDNSIVDPGKLTWISKFESPIVSFKTSKFSDSCEIFPMGDPIWVSVTGDPNIGQRSLESRNSDEFTFDLSQIPEFDLKKISDRKSNVKIICKGENQFYNYTRVVRLIDFVPDYVLTSSNGFSLNEDPFTTEITVRSVGPYRFLNCEYGIDNEAFVRFNEKDSVVFNKRIDFNFYGTGIHTLNLQCEDLVGNIGPLKTFDFNIDKESTIEIDELELIRDSVTYRPDLQNKIFIDERDDFRLEFKTNRKNNVDCSYIVNSNTLFSNTIQFVKDLFNVGSTRFENDLPYLFGSSGISFPDDDNILRIDCSVEGTSISNEESYNVIFDNNEEPIIIDILGS